MFTLIGKTKRQKEGHLVLAEHHLHSQRGVSLFGEDDCEEAVLGIDATERFKKKKACPPV